MLGPLAFATSAFWMLMIYDCIKNEPKGSSWLWLLIVLHFPAAVIYFLLRKLPYLNIPTPSFFKRWTMKDALWNAEAAVQNIGKSHQYVILGNVLLEMGEHNRALAAYLEALVKEPDYAPALFGCGKIEMQQKKFELAVVHLKALMQKDPEYKRGEASFLYGKALYETAQWSTAKTHLEQDAKYWGHSESWLLLAKIALRQEGDSLQDSSASQEAARSYLNTMITKLKASPKYHYRLNQHLIHEAEKMLKTLR
jgi:tetratricopeptide (TPR) repeat protein